LIEDTNLARAKAGSTHSIVNRLLYKAAHPRYFRGRLRRFPYDAAAKEFFENPPNSSRYIALDFLQYTRERPEMTSQDGESLKVRTISLNRKIQGHGTKERNTTTTDTAA